MDLMELAEIIKNAKERPEVEAILTEKHPCAYDRNPRNLFAKSETGKMYIFLKENSDKAFTSSEIAEAMKSNVNTTMLNNLTAKGFVFKSKFPIPTGKTFCSTGNLFSYSEKVIWKRIFDMIPKNVKQALFMILKNRNMIFCIRDLQQLTGITYGEKFSWLDRVFIRAFTQIFGKALLQKRQITGLRTFYYHPNITEEKFQELYRRYYEKEILAQESLSKLKGQYFEDFATWTFCEYMKLKGLNLELKKVDREPCDYIANIKINIGDLMVRNPEKEINVAQFVISCKNWNLDRYVSGNYVLGMSGALSRGMAFNGEQLFTPCRSVGVIIGIKANFRAWKMAVSQGILIIDLWKLMRMYQVVNQTTGQTHPYYDRISMKIEAYRNKNI
jgi:hypothetical protein